MGHPHGNLVQQAMLVDTVALGTLGARTAIALNTAFNALTATFLMMRVRYLLKLSGSTLGDDGPILIGIAKGNASIAEIGSAMIENNTSGPEDVTQSLTEDTSFSVYQNTVVSMIGESTVEDGHPATKSGWIRFGGKRGIPASEGSGWQLFAFNSGSSALTTGAVVNGLAHTQGVWLRD